MESSNNLIYIRRSTWRKAILSELSTPEIGKEEAYSHKADELLKTFGIQHNFSTHHQRDDCFAFEVIDEKQFIIARLKYGF